MDFRRVLYTRAIFVLILFSGLVVSQHAYAATYYVDSVGGSNSNNGTNTSSAWQTLSKVNSSTFSSGDSILFKAGDTWREQLTVPSSGSSGNPITFGSYGSGAQPIINGSDLVTNWAQNTGYVLQQASGASDNSNGAQFGNSPWIAANFVANGNYTATQVSVGLRIGAGHPFTSAVHAYIYTDSGGHPGSSLGEATATTQPTLTNSTVFYPWTFSGIALTSGATYWVVLKITTEDDNNYANQRELFVGSGSLQTMFSSNGTSWTQADLAQGTFSVYVTQVTLPNVWQASVASQPNQVFFNGTLGTQQNSTGALAKAGDWYWAGGTLYVYATSNPATVYTSPGIEASQRNEAIDLDTHDYVNISGLDLTKSNGDGLDIFTANNINVDSITSEYNYSMGIQQWAPSGVVVNLTNSILRYNGGNGYEPNAITNSTISGVQAYNNCTFDSNVTAEFEFCAGIRPEGGSSTTNNIIEKNDVYYNGITRSVWTEIAGIWLDTVGAGNIVRYNKVHENLKYGIFNEASSDTSIYGNLVYGQSNSTPIGRGLMVGRGSQNVVTYNNTIYGNFRGLAAEGDNLSSGAYQNNIFKNNISIGNTLNFFAVGGAENDGTNGSGNIYTYNDFGPAFSNFIEWGSGTFKSTYSLWEAAAGNCGTAGCSHSVQSDPLLTNPASQDFTLQSSSPAIDTGLNLGSTYDLGLDPASTWPAAVSTLSQALHGLGWDLGAYVFTESTAPTVSLTAPADAATVSGAAVALTATASDNSAVAGVQFKLDTNTNIGAEDTSSPYVITWDSTAVADGTHTMVAVARDTYGNYGTSSVVTVTIHNMVPAQTTSTTGGVGSGNNGALGTPNPFGNPPTVSPTSAVSATAPSSPPLTLSKNHQIWDTGEDIRALQKWFNAHGFVIAATGAGSPGHETAIFGNGTYKALIKFQKSKRLPQTGYLGPLTRAALAATSTAQ